MDSTYTKAGLGQSLPSKPVKFRPPRPVSPLGWREPIF